MATLRKQGVPLQADSDRFEALTATEQGECWTTIRLNGYSSSLAAGYLCSGYLCGAAHRIGFGHRRLEMKLEVES